MGQVAPLLMLDLVSVATQHIYIVRHGDKYSSYPACNGTHVDKDGTPCFDEKLMGNNPPLTPCGIKQANYTSDYLLRHYDINNIVVSPFTRTLQTSLPLAQALGYRLNVEPLLSE